MDQTPDKSNFQIILQSDNMDDFSEYWQDQCKYLYDEICMALPEDSIKPSTRESETGEKAVEIAEFSTLIINDIVANLIASLLIEGVIEALKNWSEYRQNANITLKYPDESKIKISKEFLSKLLTYSKENPQLSIVEILNHFKKSKE